MKNSSRSIFPCQTLLDPRISTIEQLHEITSIDLHIYDEFFRFVLTVVKIIFTHQYSMKNRINAIINIGLRV